MLVRRWALRSEYPAFPRGDQTLSRWAGPFPGRAGWFMRLPLSLVPPHVAWPPAIGRMWPPGLRFVVLGGLATQVPRVDLAVDQSAGDDAHLLIGVLGVPPEQLERLVR